MTSRLMSVASMKDLLSFEAACDAGYDPQERVAAEAASYYHEREEIAASLGQQAQEGAAELNDLHGEVQSHANHNVASTQLENLKKSAADLRMIEAQAVKTLIRTQQHLWVKEGDLRGLRQHVQESQQKVKKLEGEHPVSGLTREFGHRIVDYISDYQQRDPIKG